MPSYRNMLTIFFFIGIAFVLGGFKGAFIALPKVLVLQASKSTSPTVSVDSISG